MSLSAAVIDAMVAAGCTAEQLAAAVKADLVEQEARKDAKRANNAERQRRFKARRRGEMSESNAGNALPDVTFLDKKAPHTPKKIKPTTPPIVPPKRGSAPAKPDDVTDQVWADWTELRRRKRAPISPGVIDGARREAAKLNWTLDRTLAEWVFRGSQGFQAEWVTPDKQTAANDGGGFMAHLRQKAQSP